MAEVKVTEKRIPQPPVMQPVPQPDRIEKQVVLTLSEGEAVALVAILGKRLCGDRDSGIADTGDIYSKLRSAGFSYDWKIGIETSNNLSWKFVRRGK